MSENGQTGYSALVTLDTVTIHTVTALSLISDLNKMKTALRDQKAKQRVCGDRESWAKNKSCSPVILTHQVISKTKPSRSNDIKKISRDV